MTKTFYVLKVKGKAKIPDYIQVRDEDFTLVGYFRPHGQKLANAVNDPNQELFLRIETLSTELPYGTITPIQLEVNA